MALYVYFVKTGTHYLPIFLAKISHKWNSKLILIMLALYMHFGAKNKITKHNHNSLVRYVLNYNTAVWVTVMQILMSCNAVNFYENCSVSQNLQSLYMAKPFQWVKVIMPTIFLFPHGAFPKTHTCKTWKLCIVYQKRQ